MTWCGRIARRLRPYIGDRLVCELYGFLLDIERIRTRPFLWRIQFQMWQRRRQ